jgi:hypothetical protein
VAAHNRLRTPSTATLPAGGLAYHPHQHGHLIPPHGTFATHTSQLLVFSDKTALVVGRSGRLVPFVWRVGPQPPQVEGVPKGTVLCCTFGDRSTKPTLVLANAERPKDRSWAIAIPHAQMQFSDGYAPYACGVSRHLMDHVDALAELAVDAPPIVDTLHGAPDNAWLAPFQPMGRSPTQEARLEAMAAFSAILYVLGATRGALHSARLLLDGTLDWAGTWAAQSTPGRGNIKTPQMVWKVTASLGVLLPVCGVDPTSLVWQQESGHGTGLDTAMLLETDAARPSAHLELALRRALAG